MLKTGSVYGIRQKNLTAETAEDAEKVTQKTILMKLKVTDTLLIKYVLKISANPEVSAVK
jgi:hypothetical protein